MDPQILSQIATAAVLAEKESGCPAELLAAQCAIESGWLKHAPGNNCFGIKAYAGCFGKQLLPTTEWLNPSELNRFLSVTGRTAVPKGTPTPRRDGRIEYACQDYFATFAVLADCFSFRGRLFNTGRYKAAADAYEQDHDFVALVRTIAPIYATDPNYADSVLTIARQSNVTAAIAAARQQPNETPVIDSTP